MIEFLAANLPIVICSIIGVGLLVLEAFMPGFGIAGITGIILETVAVVLTYLKHGFPAPRHVKRPAFPRLARANARRTTRRDVRE